jgi:hypothetical protein
MALTSAKFSAPADAMSNGECVPPSPYLDTIFYAKRELMPWTFAQYFVVSE